MPLSSARFPHRIFRKNIQDSTNSDQQSEYLVYRAIVQEVDTVGGKYNNGKSPQNSIRVKIIKPAVDTSDGRETILWPINDYIVNPVFPTEEVLCIFETDRLDFGYWLSRMPNKDRSYIPASETVTVEQENDSAAAFGVERTEQQVTLDDMTSSQQNQQQEINKYEKYRKNFKFDKRLQDTIISSKGTSRIVLGSDRTSNKDSGYEDGEAIDVVVGVKKENGDPDFENDSARIYISSKAKEDIIGNKDAETIAFVKADNISLIGRKDFTIKSEDGQTEIKIDSANQTLIVNTTGKINITASNEVTIDQAKVTINSPSVTIVSPDIKLQGTTVAITGNETVSGGLNVAGAVAAASLGASSPMINVNGLEVNLQKLKSDFDAHMHPIPIAITPVTSSPPIPIP
jgi:hypothetical protein